jgi:multidrug efflux system membrane fusion protein
MRIVPLITAILVTGVMYLAVFERDALLAFARGDRAVEAMEADDADTMSAASSMVANAHAEAKIRVVVQHSTAQSIDSAVVLRGQTQAARQVEVRSEVAAVVISEPLRKGSFVERGDILCRLDPGSRKARVAEANLG